MLQDVPCELIEEEEEEKEKNIFDCFSVDLKTLCYLHQ